MARTFAVLLVLSVLAPSPARADGGDRPLLSSRGGRPSPAGGARLGGLVPVQSPSPTASPSSATAAPAESALPTPSIPAAPPLVPDASLDADPVDRWRPLVAAFADWDVDRALAVIACESAGN